MTIDQLIDRNYHPITMEIFERRKQIRSANAKKKKAERDKGRKR